MLISSAPLRFSLNGGGSDLPSYLENADGLTVAMPLNKRVYITLHESFSGRYRIAYSRIEEAARIDEIQHPIVRACLEVLNWKGPGLEITSIADVPSSGTGLGSSSAFTVALLSGLLQMQGKNRTYLEIAKLACDVEIEILKSPIGFQDQYGCALGDINSYHFRKGGRVNAKPVFEDAELKESFVEKFNESLLFFHIDQPRSANTILDSQQTKLNNDQSANQATKKMVDLATETISSIQLLDIPRLGKLMTLGWAIKSSLNGDDSDPILTSLLQWTSTAPIFGAKLLGAGGGGFLAVLAEKSNHQLVIDSLSGRHKRFEVKVEIAGPIVQIYGG
jgi:D-glycero-alpha-D-manno-heptose-7-phosphate kinase